MKIIHLTDPHLLPCDHTLYGLNPHARLSAAVDSINLLHADADACVITGDLTDDGSPEAYAALSQLVELLTPAVHFVPGNHDHKENLVACFPDLSLGQGGFLQSVVKLEDGLLFLLDSTSPGTGYGSYCHTRLTWLEHQLQAAAGEDVFLFMHHPPFAVGMHGMDASSIPSHQATPLGELLASHGRVRHLFFGHLHRPLSGTWRGIGFSTLPATSHQVGLDLGSTAEAHGCKEPPAYGIVHTQAELVLIHTHSYLDKSRHFSFHTT